MVGIQAGLGKKEVPVPEDCVVRYAAAGGVVVHDGRVLVLRRPSRGEVRLPKGHVEPGEAVEETALREVSEEGGYVDLVLEADLGAQEVAFSYKGQRYARTERYFLMALAGDAESARPDGEAQFDPAWLSWDDALRALSYEAEREWVRRAKRKMNEE
jgi:8-oxo-dGTP pyrophosphatase MutT (NUDIX family)